MARWEAEFVGCGDERFEVFLKVAWSQTLQRVLHDVVDDSLREHGDRERHRIGGASRDPDNQTNAGVKTCR